MSAINKAPSSSSKKMSLEKGAIKLNIAQPIKFEYVTAPMGCSEVRLYLESIDLKKSLEQLSSGPQP